MEPRKRKLLLAAAIVLTVTAAGTLLFRQIPEQVSLPLFLLVVILEVVIAPIPGGAIGYLGAARFGFWQAWPILYIGNIVGTTLVFWLARRYGAPLFHENVSASARRRYDTHLQKRPALLWLVYAVPLFPVDVLSILAGLSSIPIRRFILIAYSGYLSYTAIVAYVGAFLAEYIGTTRTISMLGGIFFLAMIIWLWRESRGKRRAAREASAG